MSLLASVRMSVIAPIVGSLFVFAGVAHATSLTFQFYSDSGKTTPVLNAGYNFQSYGDNVTDFDPAAQIDGRYVRYGSEGGITPDVTVEYRQYVIANPSNNVLTTATYYRSKPSDNFGDLAQVVYPSITGSYFEIRFTPTNGRTVTLESFDLAGYLSDRTVPNIEAIQDIAGTPSTLWGPFTNTVISGTTHNHFTPNVSVTAGQTLSLVYGDDVGGIRGISNIVFSVPEPASLGLLLLGGAAMLARRRA